MFTYDTYDNGQWNGNQYGLEVFFTGPLIVPV